MNKHKCTNSSQNIGGLNNYISTEQIKFLSPQRTSTDYFGSLTWVWQYSHILSAQCHLTQNRTCVCVTAVNSMKETKAEPTLLTGTNPAHMSKTCQITLGSSDKTKPSCHLLYSPLKSKHCLSCISITTAWQSSAESFMLLLLQESTSSQPHVESKGR